MGMDMRVALAHVKAELKVAEAENYQDPTVAELRAEVDALADKVNGKARGGRTINVQARLDELTADD